MKKIIFDFASVEQGETTVDIKKNKTQKNNMEDMFDYINSIMNNRDYGIGLHSIQGSNQDNVMKNIMEKGLKIDEKKKILSTVSSFGIHDKINKDYLKDQITQYHYGKQEEIKRNVIILVPLIISNSKGEKIYLGFPPYDTECHGNDFRTSCVLDTLCVEEKGEGKIPPELILGSYIKNNEELSFIKNPNYFELLSEEEKNDFFTKMKERLQGKYKEISDAVITEDINTLEKMSQEEKNKIDNEIEEGTRRNILERGINRQLAKTLSKNFVQIKQDDSATQALGYI